MINLQVLFTLTSPFVAAASGLVIQGHHFLLVADDENHLIRIDRTRLTGEMIQLFSETLPDDPKARKQVKPDFESLIEVPVYEQLLVMPSGSTPKRMRGAWVNRSGEWKQTVDLKDFFAALSSKVKEINIEGGVAFDRELYLLQRGNGAAGENGLVLAELTSPDHLVFKSYLPISLPQVDGVPYTFTDACAYQGRLLFVAVAEDSKSTYADGEVKGSIVGVLTRTGQIEWQDQLNTRSKPEGIAWDEKSQRMYLVTDDDDRSKPSQILVGSLFEKP